MSRASNRKGNCTKRVKYRNSGVRDKNKERKLVKNEKRLERQLAWAERRRFDRDVEKLKERVNKVNPSSLPASIVRWLRSRKSPSPALLPNLEYITFELMEMNWLRNKKG